MPRELREHLDAFSREHAGIVPKTALAVAVALVLVSHEQPQERGVAYWLAWSL